MKRMNQWLAFAGAIALLASSMAQLPAQDRENRDANRDGDRGGRGPGGFDPAQFQERMMERVKEQLEITNEDEWKAISPLITKVMEARRDVMVSGMGGMRGFFGRGRGGDRGGDNNPPPGDQNRERRGGGGGFFGEPGPESEALQKAIESKASASDLKAAMAKFREAQKAKETKLQKSQDELRKVLTVRQEAILVSTGTLN